MNELINNEGVCRTAPATPGLLITTAVNMILPGVASYVKKFYTL